MQSSGQRAALLLLACVAAPGGAATTEKFRVTETGYAICSAQNPKVDKPRRFANRRYSGLIETAARNAALEPALVHAVIAVESGYNQEALSPKGAIGLMQVLPETASRFGVADPASSMEANLLAGTRYLRHLMRLFDDRLELVIAAYNAGEHAVLRHGNRIPPYRETQQYVPAVMARYLEWRDPEPSAIPAAPARTGILYMPGTSFIPEASGKSAYRLITTPFLASPASPYFPAAR